MLGSRADEPTHACVFRPCAGGALSYTDNGHGTVTDNRTGVTWEKKTDADVNNHYTWLGALDYVGELNAMNGGAGFAGHNEWRLPNPRSY